jgi:hypothetical protein
VKHELLAVGYIGKELVPTFKLYQEPLRGDYQIRVSLATRRRENMLPFFSGMPSIRNWACVCESSRLTVILSLVEAWFPDFHLEGTIRPEYGNLILKRAFICK